MSTPLRQDFGELSRAAQDTAWHHLTLAPGQATLDGEAVPLGKLLRAEDFAANWFILWLVANPDPHLPDAAIRQAQRTVTAGWLRDLGRCPFARAFPGDLVRRLRADDAPPSLSFNEPPPDRSTAPVLREAEGLTAGSDACARAAIGDSTFETPQ